MQSFKKPLIFVIILFFLFGFITCLNDILIPHLRGLFTLNYTQAMLVQVCFFSAYFFMSIPSGRITNKKGYRFGIVAGLGITALGTLGFVPAAELGSFGLFLISLFILASGVTLLQVAVNPYVTLLGPPESSAFRLNLVQAFNSLGTTIAPLLGSILILESTNKVTAIQKPYLLLTIILLFVAFIFSKIALPNLSNFSNEEVPAGDDSFSESLKQYARTMKEHPHVIKGMLSIFLYVGAEVSIGSFLVAWIQDSSVAGLSLEEAGKYVSFYWGGAMVGRFAGSYLTTIISPSKILKYSLLTIVFLILFSVLMYRPGLSMWPIILIGLFNSVQFPIIFSLSVANLKKDTPYASGLLCTCIVGGALIPLIQGLVADNFSLRWAFLIPLICYFSIFIISSKLENKK